MPVALRKDAGGGPADTSLLCTQNGTDTCTSNAVVHFNAGDIAYWRENCTAAMGAPTRNITQVVFYPD